MRSSHLTIIVTIQQIQAISTAYCKVDSKTKLKKQHVSSGRIKQFKLLPLPYREFIEPGLIPSPFARQAHINSTLSQVPICLLFSAKPMPTSPLRAATWVLSLKSVSCLCVPTVLHAPLSPAKH